MGADEAHRAQVDAFCSYIEDMVAIDDRYGPPNRAEGDGGSERTSRFEVGRACWLEVAVLPAVPGLRVGFLTRSEETTRELEQMIRDSGQTAEAFVNAAFREAGLDSPESVAQTADEGTIRYATLLQLDELADLERQEIRDKALRVLEGYLIAFGPTLVVEDEEE